MTPRRRSPDAPWPRALLCAAWALLLSLGAPLRAQEPPCDGIKASDRAVFSEALDLYGKRNYREAAQRMRRVATRNGRAPEPQFWLGMMAVKDGFNTTAIRRYFSKCIELCPDYPHPLAHYYMGLIHYTDDRFDEAAVELERYFALAAGSGDAAVAALYEEASNYLYWSQFLAEAYRNMAPFDPQRVAGASSRHNEMYPFLSLDGQTLYYLREMPVSNERTFYSRELEQKQWRLFSSKRLDDTAFSRGAELPPPFNSGDPEGSLCLTADGNELFFSIIRNEGGYANSDIYCVRRVGGQWQQPENCGPQVNGSRSWESQPSVSADGSTLYFASNRQGGQGGIDLWRCRRLKNGDWSRAENLGPAINTPGNEKCPFLAADGHTLYFLSDGWQGFGGYDIYFSNLADPYGNRPTNLGLPVNSEGDEVSFGVTADGRKAYFGGRLANSRSTDILMFDLYPAARPDPMRLCALRLEGPAATVGDTLLLLPEREPRVLTLARGGALPFIACLKAHELQALGGMVRLADSVAPLRVAFLPDGSLDLRGEQVVDAWAAWLVEHPRVHVAVECPKRAEAEAVGRRLKAAGLRPDRLLCRGGTDIKSPQIRLL